MLSGLPIPKDIARPPETILVNIAPHETRVAVLEENNICELHIERNSEHSLVGNIYLGVVHRVLPGMQSTFIDIDLERAAFLHIVDVLEQHRNPEETQRIEHMLLEGQSASQQVIKDPINTKGARLSTQISLAGHFLVHLRKKTTSECTNASKTMPNAAACENDSTSYCRKMPAGATSSAPTPKTPQTNSSSPTSTT